MELKEKLLFILNHYGLNAQLKYLQSEVFEFNEAMIQCLHKNNLEKCNLDHIKKELADVYCILEMFKLYYKFTNKELNEIIEFKVNRQIKRIENE